MYRFTKNLMCLEIQGLGEISEELQANSYSMEEKGRLWKNLRK